MTYCANDVSYTKALLEKIYPVFSERCPHPVSLAGLLEMGSVFLPVNRSWKSYIESAKLVSEKLFFSKIDSIIFKKLCC